MRIVVSSISSNSHYFGLSSHLKTLFLLTCASHAGALPPPPFFSHLPLTRHWEIWFPIQDTKDYDSLIQDTKEHDSPIQDTQEYDPPYKALKSIISPDRTLKSMILPYKTVKNMIPPYNTLKSIIFPIQDTKEHDSPIQDIEEHDSPIQDTWWRISTRRIIDICVCFFFFCSNRNQVGCLCYIRVLSFWTL